MKVRFTPRAQRRVEFIAKWWRDHRPAAPALFEEELSELLDRLVEHPTIGTAYHTVDDVVIRGKLMPRTAVAARSCSVLFGHPADLPSTDNGSRHVSDRPRCVLGLCSNRETVIEGARHSLERPGDIARMVHFFLVHRDVQNELHLATIHDKNFDDARPQLHDEAQPRDRIAFASESQDIRSSRPFLNERSIDHEGACDNDPSAITPTRGQQCQ